MSNVRRVCETEAVKAVGLLNPNQNLFIDCAVQDPNKLVGQLAGRYRNMGLLFVIYDGRAIYVERLEAHARQRLSDRHCLGNGGYYPPVVAHRNTY